MTVAEKKKCDESEPGLSISPIMEQYVSVDLNSWLENSISVSFVAMEVAAFKQS